MNDSQKALVVFHFFSTELAHYAVRGDEKNADIITRIFNELDGPTAVKLFNAVEEACLNGKEK